MGIERRLKEAGLAGHRASGPDLRPLAPGDAGSVVYGLLPYALFEDIRLKFIAALKSQTARTVPRS